jgi:hypothetical protein
MCPSPRKSGTLLKTCSSLSFMLSAFYNPLLLLLQYGRQWFPEAERILLILLDCLQARFIFSLCILISCRLDTSE